MIDKFRRDNGLTYDAAQVTVNVGGKHTLFNAMVATVGEGDEVIVPAPYWVSYPDIVNFAGGTPVFIEAPAAQGYKITPAQLDAAITPRTKAIVVINPNNPTGAVYSREVLEGIVALARKHSLLILAD